MLQRSGVSGQFLSLVQSFLKDPKQRTDSNGKSSNQGDVLAGVPEGSFLGALFFEAPPGVMGNKGTGHFYSWEQGNILNF